MAKKLIRESWRPRGAFGASARTWLIARRLVATIVCVSLLAFFVYYVISPWFSPNTYLVYLTAGDYLIYEAEEPRGGEPIEFVWEDFAGLIPLEDVLASNAQAPLILDLLKSPRSWERQMENLRSANMRSNDTLILHIAAHGIVEGNEPYLKCTTFDAASPEEGRLRVADVLQTVAELTPATKLLIVDAGREEDALHSGMLVNSFPFHLKRVVEQQGDPSVWVLSANSSMEMSHVSPGLRRSVFGYFLAHGLRGDADLDSDKDLRLNELYQYMRHNVSKWVEQATDGNTTQTPLLLSADLGQATKNDPLLLSLKRLPAHEPDVEEDLETAKSSSSVISTMSEYAKNFAGQFGLSRLLQGAEGAAKAIGSVALSGDGEAKDKDDESDPDGVAKAGPNEGSSEADASTAPVSAEASARRRLLEAWKLAASPEGAWDNAQLIDQLLWYDGLHRAGLMTDQKIVDQKLEYIVRAMKRSLGENPTFPMTTTVPIGSQEVRSFALAEIIARSGGEALPKNLVEFNAAFDKALAADTQSELDELLESALPKLEPGWERFYEFHLLGGLGARADLSWPLLKLALATRREGEKAAAELLSGSGWARESLEIPDRLRWEAERLIRTRAASDWDTLASANLENARTLYKEAARSLRVVSQSGRLRERVLARGRDYLHWRGLSRKDKEDGVPSQSDIETLFEEVRRLDETLKSPRSDVASVQNQLNRLQSIVVDVEKGVTADAIAQLAKAEYSGDAWRMKILLDTKLPSAELRQSLGEKVADVSTKLSKTFTFGRGRLRPTTTEGRAITAEDWQLAKNRLEAEGLFASLSQCSSAPAINAALEGFDDLDDQARWKAITEASELLQGFYAALPDAIRAWMQANGDYSIAEQRARLRAAAHDMHLLYPRDAAKLEEDLELQASVLRTAWYDLLAWHSQRFRNAAADATDNELRWLIDARGDYRKLASKVLANQPLPAYVKRGLRLEETPSQIDLSSRDQLQAEVEFNIVGTEMPVWLILQYDNDLLQVQSFENNPDRTYHEHDLRREVRELAAENSDGDFVGRTASQSDDYPYRPDLFELPSTLRLPPNGTTAVKLRIRRQNGADGSAKLVVKAIGRDTYVRREIEIALPSQAKYQLLVEGEDRQRSLNRNGDGVVLRALPNRVQDFAFQIVNATKSPGKVTAELYATRYDVPVVFEQGPLPPSQAAALLKRFRPLQRFGHSEIEFLATDEAKRVTFPPSKPEQPGPKIVAIPQEDADGIELPGLPAPSGLLMVITDVPTGHKTFRRIQFQARRPRDYLVATATYLSVQERLEIKLTASDENVIPDDGLTIECGFEGLEAGTEATKEATLSPPKYEATLSAVVPKGSKVIARVAVDEYPRAFVFEMNCRDTVQKQEPLKAMEEIRIESPERGEAYPGSAKTIKVRVAVDAPWGSFESKGDYVEVGIDPDRDRELDDDETLQLFADRQVEYFVKALQPDGTLRINTQAGDFELDVPLGRLNVRAYLLGRLVVDSNDTWSTEAQEPVEVVIDDSSPEIEKTTALNPPSREIPIDGEFQVLIRAKDTNSEGVALSGVKMIEVAFDQGGEFSENEPVEMAKLRPADGVWIADMKAADLAEGNYVIVVRPTDKVGNFEKQRGELYRIEVKVVSPTSAEKEMAVTNAVTGKLSHGKNPFSELEDSEVTLTSEGEPLKTRQVRINEQGGFAFSKVPPGKYILSAKAFSANRWRKVEDMKVTVSSDPKTPVQLGAIKVKTF